MDDSDWYSAEVYVRGTNLLAKFSKQSGGVKTDYQYYTQNAHGDVVNLTDADGAVIKSYTYDAFGVEVDPNSGDVNVFRFCGEYFDTETGTIYLRARYYQASIGRFISRDSYTGKNTDPLSLNLYTYCRNNPIFYFDPFGHLYSNGKKDYVRDIIESGAEKTKEKNKTIITGKTENSVNQKQTYAYQECDGSFWSTTKCMMKAVLNSTTLEYGGGVGIGGSVKVGVAEVSLLAAPIRNEKVYGSRVYENNCSAWFSASVSILDGLIGIGADAKKTAPARVNEKGNLNDSNPFDAPDAIWETETYFVSEYSTLDFQNFDCSLELGGSLYLGLLGGDVTLSFDLNNYFKEMGIT